MKDDLEKKTKLVLVGRKCPKITIDENLNVISNTPGSSTYLLVPHDADTSQVLAEFNPADYGLDDDAVNYHDLDCDSEDDVHDQIDDFDCMDYHDVDDQCCMDGYDCMDDDDVHDQMDDFDCMDDDDNVDQGPYPLDIHKMKERLSREIERGWGLSDKISTQGSMDGMPRSTSETKALSRNVTEVHASEATPQQETLRPDLVIGPEDTHQARIFNQSPPAQQAATNCPPMPPPPHQPLQQFNPQFGGGYYQQPPYFPAMMQPRMPTQQDVLNAKPMPEWKLGGHKF